MSINKALLYKWKWRYCNNMNSVRSKVIRACHGIQFGMQGVDMMKGGGGVWNNILTSITKMHIASEVDESVMRRKVGDGFDTRWDKWRDTTTFKDKYDRRYALSMNKNKTVRCCLIF